MTCPHCGARIFSARRVSTGRIERIMTNGGKGICMSCCQWATYKDGELLKYEPTADEHIVMGLDLIRQGIIGQRKAGLN